MLVLHPAPGWKTMELLGHGVLLDAPDGAAFGGDAGLGAALRAAEDECRRLHALLPQPERWDGVARRAFDERVAALRRLIDRAASGLRAAERGL